SCDEDVSYEELAAYKELCIRSVQETREAEENYSPIAGRKE
ncbi:hypothetical protein A2U01_0059532, partial [Trifolium medium]|nr:hypothetical protein [Trifolium medium]